MKLFLPRWRTWICLIQVVAFALSCSLATGCSKTGKSEAKKGRSKVVEDLPDDPKPAPAPAADSDALRILAVKDYISPEIIKDFAKEHKVKIQMDTFTEEKEFNKLWKDGEGGYDLVLPPQDKLAEIIMNDQAAELDKKALPNLKHVDPKLMGPYFDKEGKYTVPWFFIPMVALGVRTDKVTKPVKGLDILSEEAYKGQIGFGDLPDHIIPTYLFYLNATGTDFDDKSLAKVKEALSKQRPLIKEFSADSLVDKLKKGDVWLVLDSYSNLSALVGTEDKNLRLVIPSSGVPLWVDSLCVVKDSPKADLAFNFLNYLLEPDVCHQNVLETGNATVNLTTRSKLEPAMRDDLIQYPPSPAKVTRLHEWMYTALDEAQTKKAMELWKEVKDGKK